MEPDNSHEQVSELLRLLPGLEVQRTWVADGLAHFWMKIDSMDCLGRLVQHVTFCNTGVGVDLAGQPTGYGGPAPSVRFTLRLAHDADPAKTPSQLEILGIFFGARPEGSGFVAANARGRNAAALERGGEMTQPLFTGRLTSNGAEIMRRNRICVNLRHLWTTLSYPQISQMTADDTSNG
jgi:hypothetical protein